MGKAIDGKRVAKVMRDGTTLCEGFQRADCKQKGEYTNGAHRCGVITKGDRVCGASGNGAHTCRANVRE